MAEAGTASAPGLGCSSSATCWEFRCPTTWAGILLVVGIILMVLGSTDRAVGGRRHYF
jgi:hypothetical protein